MTPPGPSTAETASTKEPARSGLPWSWPTPISFRRTRRTWTGPALTMGWSTPGTPAPTRWPSNVHDRIVPDVLDEFAPPDDDSTHGVTVAVDVLGQRVDDQVRAVVEGAVERGGRERGVDRQQDAGVFGYAGKLRHIRDLGCWVRHGFGVDQLCAGTNGCPYCLEVIRIHEGGLNAVLLRKKFPEQAVHRLVGHVGNHHVITRFQEGEE